MQRVVLPLLAVWLTACADDPPAAGGTDLPDAASVAGPDVLDAGPVDAAAGADAEPQLTGRDDGWLRGDLHMHTTHSDGWDSVPTVIALAEYLEDADFLAAHPEYAGNGLDYIAVSDHRTVAIASDPDFVSERLVLIPSEEFGRPGHANTPGATELLHHDPDGDGTTLEDIRAAVDAAHAQGALFSPNHLFLPKVPFPWDVRNMDTIEVWNSGWALVSEPYPPEKLTRWEASHGPASPMFARAVELQGALSSTQTLVYYEALLARGVHVGLVGGSDRHAVVLPGFPTTYVRTASVDMAGLLDGMRARHTYVTRTPASVQLAGTLRVGTDEYELGDPVPVPAGGGQVELELLVTRAAGGLLRVRSGGAVDSDEALAGAELGELLVEEAIEEAVHVHVRQLEVAPGDWLYPLVLEPLVAPGTSPECAETVREAARLASTSGDDVEDLVPFILPLVDQAVLGDATRCNPEDWQPCLLQCATADQEGIGSFFVPEPLDRAMNAWVEDGAVTEWCMGAVASAVLFVEE